MDSRETYDEHRTLCIMPTYQCTAECTHCGTVSSPRDKTWLPGELLHEAIEQAAVAGYQLIVFTGGEPTLAGDALLHGMRHAALLGMGVRLVTNAHWANSSTAAARRIQDFVGAGLNEINLSTGDQHARFVPPDNIMRATRAAVRAGLKVVISVETVRERVVTKETVESHPDFLSLREEYPSAWLAVVESIWSPVTPFAREKYAEGATVNRSNLARCQGCDSVLTTTTLKPDGNLSPCCGLGIRFLPELQIGNLRETSLAEANRAAAGDFLKRWIRKEGPERILAWAATHNPEIKWENMYAHRCQACIRLYKDQKIREVISEHYEEKIGDIW